MKNLLKTIAIAICISACYGCSVEPIDTIETEANIISDTQDVAEVASCVDQNPEIRITNNGTIAIDLDIINEDYDVVGFVHNLLPGETSIWISFAPGNMVFSLNHSEFGEKLNFDMNSCMIFEMEVDATNKFTDAVPQQL